MRIRTSILLLVLLMCSITGVAQTYSFTVTPSDLKSGDALHWSYLETWPAHFTDMSSYVFSSSCPQIMIFGETLDVPDSGGPGGSFHWFDDLSPWLAFDDTTVCTFTITKDGAVVATATATFEATPQDNMGPQDCCGGEPIDLGSGNVYIQQTDISVPGLNGGLQLVRTWNSLFSQFHGDTVSNGFFGNNWRCNYEERIVNEGAGVAHYWRGDGSVWNFQGSGNPASHYTLAKPGSGAATLDQGSQYWTVTFKGGERRLFNLTTGNLVAIQDRNGNTTTISYDALGRILTVTDPAARHLFFHYSLAGVSNQVISVTSDVGITVSYRYSDELDLIVTNSEMLSQVIYPDQSTITFNYVFSPDFRSTLISAVLDSNEKVIESHTYDSSNRGLTSSKANGVEKLTVTYP